MRIGGWVLAVFAALSAAGGMPAHCLGRDGQAVDEAIRAAKNYLYNQIKEDNWETTPEPDPKKAAWDSRGGQWGLQTAVAVVALLESGENAQNPKLASAIRWLQVAPVHGVAALSLRCRVWFLLREDPVMRQCLHADGLAIQAARKHGKAAGYWDYGSEKGDQSDRNASQYAIFGLRSCVDLDEVEDEIWQQADTAWRRDQRPDGSWSYERGGAGGGGASVTMTSEGLATLMITNDLLGRNQPADTPGNPHDKNVELGMAWLGRHIDAAFHDRTNLESAYAISRVGTASGLRLIGGTDWYAHGSEFLLSIQDKETGRIGTSGGFYRNVRNTAFGLIFLARGRFPVVMNKLDYGRAPAVTTSGPSGEEQEARELEAHWNQRPHDVLNLARWVGRKTESNLRWQIALPTTPARELHDAPILYIAGDQALALSAEAKSRLRDFALQGGLIFGNADFGSETFADSFQKLGKELFPEYAFAALPERHAIYVDEQYPAEKFKQAGGLTGLSNGVRELMLIDGVADPAKSWNYMLTASGEDHFMLGANVFLYAGGKLGIEPHENYIVARDDSITAERTLKVARLKYDGNWDPEPYGWERLGAIMHNLDKVDLEVKTVELGSGGLSGISVAHLTGTGQIKLSDGQMAELRDFVHGGGLLVIDAAGGAGNVSGSGFAASIESQFDAMFGAGAAELRNILPSGDALYAAGPSATAIGYREYARKFIGHEKGSRLRGLHVDGHLAVVYSPEDISAGLVGEPMDGIVGYDPATAVLLMRKVLAEKLGQK